MNNWISDEDKELENLLTGYQDMVGLVSIHKVARINTQVTCTWFTLSWFYLPSTFFGTWNLNSHKHVQVKRSTDLCPWSSTDLF